MVICNQNVEWNTACINVLENGQMGQMKIDAITQRMLICFHILESFACLLYNLYSVNRLAAKLISICFVLKMKYIQR